MKSSPALDHLAELLDGEAISPETVRWLRDGFRRYRDGEPLNAALGLNAVHSRGAPYAIRHRAMVKHLRQAAGLMPYTTPWTRAELLAGQIRRFREFRWPRLRHHTEAPECLAPLDRALFGAFKAGKVPESASRLYQILDHA